MKQSIDFTKKLDPDYASFYITTVLPGSTLGENIKNKVWKDYLSGKGQLPIYRPAGISTRDLEEMHRRAFREFYIRPSYFLKRLLKIRSYHQLKNTVRSGLAVIYDFILK